MITIARDELTFRFPEVHGGARCDIAFQRTLRLPDDGRTYALPAGLGRFPVRQVDDYADRLPERSVERGGVVMPMYQAEALWIEFGSRYYELEYPCAIKVAAGKVCAVSGDPWQEGLTQDPQNYLVVPGQMWLDGFCVEKGKVRQFVAMPLGGGHTAEEQLAGRAEHGGLQIAVYPMKREVFRALFETPRPEGFYRFEQPTVACAMLEMGLAPGGLMSQEIYEDDFGLEAWDQRRGSRCFVTLANSEQWMAITGELPPTRPPTARDYAEAGLPWFLHYDADREALEGAERLAGLKSVGEAADAAEAAEKAQVVVEWDESDEGGET